MFETNKNIKKLRKELHLTQEELAKKVGYSERSIIAKIEKGESDVPLKKIPLFAKALGVTPSELMGMDGLSVDSERYLVAGYKALNNRGREELINYLQYLLSREDTKKGSTQEEAIS